MSFKRTYLAAWFFARLLGLFLVILVVTPAVQAASDDRCGAVVSLSGHGGDTFRYSLAGVSQEARAVVVLLPGGHGFLKLNNRGCPRKLKGNSLVRSQSLFHGNAVATALVDAPSGFQQKEGLGGYRIEPGHAEDLGKVIVDVRRRTGLPVWLVGTSRGSISAANAATRLSGAEAPDGLVLTSPLTSGNAGARKPWVAHSVFSLDLDRIALPVLVVVHEADKCVRTPPNLGARVLRKTNSSREQLVIIAGGAVAGGDNNVRACKGRSPHGFLGQEAEVADGISRFISGGKF